MSGPTVDVKLNRSGLVYAPGETVSGCVVVQSSGSMKHSGIKIQVEGTVSLQLSARSIGLFEAFYSSLKPIQLIQYEIEVSPGGKCPSGATEYPFEFSLTPLADQLIHETYHGVYVNVQYLIAVDMKRGAMSKNLKNQKEFIVQSKVDDAFKRELSDKKFPFKVSPDSLQNVKDSSKKKIPTFAFDGFLKHTTCNITEPFLGEIVIRKCEVDIKSIELQLVRVESCTYMEGEAREATEIQNIQIADGNTVRGLAIPIHMIFPRLFTCSTTISTQFKVEFEVNLIVLFADNHMITENFPIKLYRA